uniref:Potassium voltage-gated channel, Shal-related subfamily, member 2 n=1 Tax=Echinostoma caproni TaxID=27848 RepID=A0A183B3A4_9TREM
LNILINLHTSHEAHRFSSTGGEWTSQTEKQSSSERYPTNETASGTSCHRKTSKTVYREQFNVSLRHLSLPEEDANIETIKEEMDVRTDESVPCAPKFYALAEKEDSPDETDLHRPSVTELVVPLSITHEPHFNVSADDLLNMSQTDVCSRESEVSSATSDTSLPQQARDLDLQSNHSPLSSSTNGGARSNVNRRPI